MDTLYTYVPSFWSGDHSGPKATRAGSVPNFGHTTSLRPQSEATLLVVGTGTGTSTAVLVPVVYYIIIL